MKILWLLPALALCLPMDVDAAAHGSRGGKRSHNYSHRSHSSAGSHLREHGLSHRREQPPSSGTHRNFSARCTTCQRVEHGRIKRSQDANRDFNRKTYPHGRKGYVIDRVVRLPAARPRPRTCSGR